MTSIPFNSQSVTWIIDTGASDHIVSDSNLFLSLKSLPISQSMKLPTGDIVQITREGMVKLSPSLELKDVLCVPSLNLNLLSISKFTKIHNCIAIFFS